MTFTFTPSAPDDITRVRFHVEDTDESAAILSDEVIGMAISESGSWQNAVIWCIDYILSRLSKESGVEMDWLKVSRADAIRHYTRLKSEKRNTLGITSGGVTVSSTSVSRSDYD